MSPVPRLHISYGCFFVRSLLPRTIVRRPFPYCVCVCVCVCVCAGPCRPLSLYKAGIIEDVRTPTYSPFVSPRPIFIFTFTFIPSLSHFNSFRLSFLVSSVLRSVLRASSLCRPFAYPAAHPASSCTSPLGCCVATLLRAGKASPRLYVRHNVGWGVDHDRRRGDPSPSPFASVLDSSPHSSSLHLRRSSLTCVPAAPAFRR